MTKAVGLIVALFGLASATENASAPLSRTAFIVRVAANDKDLSKISNVVLWAEQLHKETPELDFWLSVDATQDHSEYTKEDWSKVPAAGNKLIMMAPKDEGFKFFEQKDTTRLQKFVTAFQEKELPLKLHVYTEQDIKQAYPDIEEAHTQAAKACNGKDWCKHPLGWQFHTQALTLWWKDNKDVYDNVWVSEPDMSFNQKLPSIVKSYAVETDKDADLVSMTMPGWPPQWMWSETATNKYLEKTTSPENLAAGGPLLAISRNFMPKNPNNKCVRTATPEYIQRFSSGLLDKLEEYCGAKGMCAHSEQYSVTVASCEGMKVKPMHPRLLLDIRHEGGPLR